jgi:ABC-type nitrate/sulfonate/bicarbonate transport system substrate-binding protein
MSIRRWIGLTITLCVGLVLAIAPQAAGQTPRVKISEAHTGTLFMAPVYIAEAAGFLSQEGIDLELNEVDSGALGIAALISGQVQFFDADPFQAVQLRRQGRQILFVYNLTKRVTLDLVMHPEVARTKNLSRSTQRIPSFARSAPRRRSCTGLACHTKSRST